MKTNINSTTDLIDTGIDKKVRRVVALSTGKTSNPLNLAYAERKIALLRAAPKNCAK